MAQQLEQDQLRPFYSVITHDGPSALDRVFGRALDDFLGQHVPVEDPAELQRRRKLLSDLLALFLEWVKDTCIAKGFGPSMAEAAGGMLFTSGSYRLGVHEPGADIDTICVIPGHITRGDFFHTFKEKLETHADVENLKAVPDAYVPIITFDLGEVNIDLLCAVLPLNSIPASLDISDNSILGGLDEQTVQSLNGPRVTNLIIKMVRGAGRTADADMDEEEAKTRYDNFLCVLRCVRIWAKKRKIYSNKLGYLGGINFNIMLALICQMYPHAHPSKLLVMFFQIFASWDWPSPVLLCNPFTLGHQWLDSQVWNPQSPQHARSSFMPIITPAYPAFNSSANVNPWTLAVMKHEFQRADAIVKRLVANAEARLQQPHQPPTPPAEATTEEWVCESRELWSELIAPSDFFVCPEYNNFLGINITARDKKDHSAWSGYVLARVRRLPEQLGLSLPLVKIHLYPQEFDFGIANTPDGNVNTSIFIAFVHDKAKDKNLDMRQVLVRFRDELHRKFKDKKDGMDIAPVHFRWKKLPPFVFESVGGKAAADKARKRAKAQASKDAGAAAAAAAAAPTDETAGAADGSAAASTPSANAAAEGGTAEDAGVSSFQAEPPPPECFAGFPPDRQAAVLQLFTTLVDGALPDDVTMVDADAQPLAPPPPPTSAAVAAPPPLSTDRVQHEPAQEPSSAEPSASVDGPPPSKRRKRMLELLGSYGLDEQQGSSVVQWLDQRGAGHSLKRKRSDGEDGAAAQGDATRDALDGGAARREPKVELAPLWQRVGACVLPQLGEQWKTHARANPHAPPPARPRLHLAAFEAK